MPLVRPSPADHLFARIERRDAAINADIVRDFERARRAGAVLRGKTNVPIVRQRLDEMSESDYATQALLLVLERPEPPPLISAR